MSKNTSNKKEQFTQPSKSKKLPLMIGVLGVLILGVLLITLGGNKEEDTVFFGDPVVSSRSYVGEVISMTEVDPVIEDGKVRISLDEVDANNVVYFEVENNENELVPLMAYITPSGRLFVGSSMCEPCRGQRFSLAGETLVCDTCRTTYDIEDHTFISGAAACGEYPPINMNPQIEDNMIVIELEEVFNWKIRV